MRFCPPGLANCLTLILAALCTFLVSTGHCGVVFATNTTWKMLKGFSEASSPDPTAWRHLAFNDTSWSSAPAPFYYTSTPTEPPFYTGGPVTGTVINDMLNVYTCIFLRKTFELTNAAGTQSATVEVAGDDGFIVWLNGVEIGRTNMPAGSIAYNGRALASLSEPVAIHSFNLSAGALLEGSNVIAVQCWNWDPGSGDFGIMAGLHTAGDESAPSLLSSMPPAGETLGGLTSINLIFSETVTNVDAGDLLINGVAAGSVSPSVGSQFSFSFPQPSTGLVNVAFSPTHGIRDFAGNLFGGAAWTYTLNTNTVGTPIISEFMADNDGSLLDGFGEPSDWIELHNPTASPVSLEDWRLRDSGSTWVFPGVTLPAGGHLIVFASGRAPQVFFDPEGYLHTNFRLDADGEPLALLNPEGTVVWEYSSPSQQRAGVSFGVLQSTVPLSTFETPARLLVPTAPVSDAWKTNRAFADSSWLLGEASAGYGNSGGGIVAYRVHAGTPGNQPIGESLGMDFVANRNVVVTELGCFDDNSDGLNRSITVQLWRRNDNGTPNNFADDSGAGIVASTTLGPGDQGALLEGSRFKALATPVTLTNGAYTIIAFGYGTGERAGNLGVSVPPDPWETQSGDGALSFVGTARPGAAGTFPTNPDGGPANRYAAGTFKFSASDDPLARTFLSDMKDVNASAFMRVSFNVPNPGSYDSLSLQLGYDDGCVVWLNGVEVSRYNAPGSLTYSSSATLTASRVETVPLAPNLLVPGTNLLAVHGLNISASDVDFYMAAALSAVDTQAETPRYLTMPTPGAPNVSSGILGYVADTKFSMTRGFYDAPFSLSITTATAGAVIRYTLDGSTPSSTHGTVFTSPIPITSTVIVRAFAYKPGYEPSNVDTHTYLFANDVAAQPSGAPPGYPTTWTDYTAGTTVAADYGMVDLNTQPLNYARAAGNSSFTAAQARAALSNSVKSLPVISIVTDRTNLFDPTFGIYQRPAARGELWERPASVELITTNGVEDWHARAGIHIMGLTSRSLNITPKLNFMLVFNAQYGETWLTEPFFGEDGPNRIKRIALRSNTRDGWLYEENGYGTATYILDGFAKESHLDSGEPATRHRYCHVFLNGMYWGLYDATERPESHWAETTFGGEDEDYDVVNLCCPNRIDSGDFTEWQQLLSTARAGLSTDTAYQAIQGNFPNGTRNPSLKRLLNVDSFIGFAINGYYHASIDWPDNFFAIYDNVESLAQGWRFVIWDTDLGFPNFNVNANKVTPPEGVGTWASHDAPFAVDAALRQNAEYRMRLADRVYREYFNAGAYSSATNLARWQRLRNAIQPGLYAESARWGDYRSGGLRTVQEHWLPRVTGPAATAWFNGRNATVISQLRTAGLYPVIDPPLFNQHGGNVPQGFQLSISNPNAGGTIYFTLDGTDPRAVGGSVRAGAQTYGQPVTLTSPTLVRARVLNGGVWSALNQAQFYPPQDLTKLQLSELMYNPPKFNNVDGDEFEFIELKNSGTNALDLTGIQFTDGIDFVFTNETQIGVGQYFVLARNAAQFAARYPSVAVNGLYTGKLDNNGETVTLSTTQGVAIFSVTYDNAAPWPAEADNSGLSLHRMNFDVSASNPTNWVATAPTPGGPLGADLRDLDGDGLSDGWEVLHSVFNPLEDEDHDGMTNYEEFRSGTNPRDDGDRLELRLGYPANDRTSVVFEIAARSNKTYSIVYRDSAQSGAWQPLVHIPSAPIDRLVKWTNGFSEANPSYFFRLATPRVP